MRTLRAEHLEYTAQTDDLLDALKDLSVSRSLEDVQGVVVRAARRLSGADGATLMVRDGSYCFGAAEDAASPMWLGRRIPLDDCVSGWTIRNKMVAVVTDISNDHRFVGYECPPQARAVVSVPIGVDAPIGAITVVWSDLRYPDVGDNRILQALADAAFVAMENTLARTELERRVRERTAELERTNAELHLEIAERAREEERAKRLSLSDELTGLLNRRGFMLLASQELKVVQRSGRRGLVLYVDLDGLKQTNDTYGHDAGDKLIVAAAGVLRHCARDADVIGRMGGDEFAVFMHMGDIGPPTHLVVERLLEAAREAGIRISVGATGTDSGRNPTLEDLLILADETMYRGRRARRSRSALPFTG